MLQQISNKLKAENNCINILTNNWQFIYSIYVLESIKSGQNVLITFMFN